MNIFLGLIPIACLGYNLTGVVFFSSLTPSHILPDFERVLKTSSSIIAYNISDSVLDHLKIQPVHAIFDYTYSLSHSFTLKYFSETRKVPCFYPRSPPENSRISHYEFYLRSDNDRETPAMKALLSYLNLTDFFIVSDSSSVKTASQLGQYSVLASHSPQKLYDKYTIQTIKPSGNWKIFVLSDEQGSKKMFDGILKANIYKERCIFIVSGRGGLNKYDVGTLILGEENLGKAESVGEFEGLTVLRAFNLIKNADPLEVLEKLVKRTENHAIVANFSVFNYRGDGRRVEIGKITPKGIKMFSNITFPGNTSKYITSKPIIQITANLGLFDYNGEFNIAHNVLTLGLKPMVSIINSDESLLKNYKLEMYGTDCGVLAFDYNYVMNCMRKHKANIKGFFIDSINGDMIKGNLKVFEDLQVSLPHIVSYIDESELYNKTMFPELLITGGHFEYIYSIIPYILSSFRWENILLLHELSEENYRIFASNCETLGIKILNTKQVVDRTRNYVYEDYVDFIYYFEEMKSSNCKIIVSLLGIPLDLLFASWLYDSGFRRGDVVFISASRSSSYIEHPTETYIHNRTKVLEIIDGSISISFIEYEGEYGENLERQIAPMILPFPTDYTSFLINSMLLGVNTLNTLIEIGFDHEDSDLVKKFIRKQNFVGTSGTLSIDSGGNGINEIRFGIFNFYVQNDTWVEDHIGDYTFGVLVPLNYSREIVWSKGSHSIPEDMVRQYPCENSRSPYTKSRWIICIFLGICLACVLGIAYKVFGVGVEMMKEVKDIMFEDAILMYTPVIEVLQYTGISPDFNPLFVLLGSIASLEFENLIEWEYGEFWKYYYILLSIVIVWILSVIVSITCLFGRFPMVIQDFIYFIGFVYFTFIAQIGFIPILKTLLKVLMCSDGLIYDCEMECWSGFHLFLCVFTMIILGVYVVCTVLMKFAVDYNMEAVNIKTVPIFVCVKTLLHLCLLILYFGQFEHHDIYFCVLFGLWGSILCKLEGYNYPRFNFWQKMLALGAFLNSLLKLVHSQMEKQHIRVFIVLQFCIIFSTGIVGFIIQKKKYPSLLYRQPNSDIHKLIKFSFGRGVATTDITVRELPYIVEECDNRDVPDRRLDIIS